MNNIKILIKLLVAESILSYSVIVVFSLPMMIADYGFNVLLMILLGFAWTLPIIFIIKVLCEFFPRIFVINNIAKKKNFKLNSYFIQSIIVSVLWIIVALFLNKITIRNLILPLGLSFLNILSIYFIVVLNQKYEFVNLIKEKKQ